MLVQVIKTSIIFFFIVLGFVLILLIPREQEVTVFSAFHIEADYPFTFKHYMENIEEFLNHFKTEKGFGTSYTGVPVSEEISTFLIRSLKIVLPAFLVSITLGTLFGILQFYYRKRKRGKIQAFFSWVFSSVPDFFLFIALQYALILAIQKGLPNFSLYGHNHWYSFIIPFISISLFPFIHMVKFTSAALEREMGQEYLRTVYAKGLGDRKAIIHILWNCWGTILNQAQLVMLYILSSLPIIEKLSGYNGAGIQLLASILSHDNVRAFGFMLPFLFLMFVTILLSQIIKFSLVPSEVGSKS